MAKAGSAPNANTTWRRIRASWRDTVLLLREFRQPLLLFVLAILGSGWLYYVLSGYAGQPVDSLAQAVYITLTLTFLQPTIDFPKVWFLQAFFFIMPVIGISILAQGLTDFGILLFNRRARGKEWEMAVASTYSNHVVLIGLGHLGYHVVKKLNELLQDVVVIELTPDADLVHSVQERGVPVIEDDGTRESVLNAAGIKKARAIILCTQNDSVNLRIALKARTLNPKIEVIIRIFDEDFAASLGTQFGFKAMSATLMAAPLFAASAANIDITPPITIEGKQHILANMEVQNGSHMDGKSVIDLEENYRVSIVLLCKDGRRDFHPAGEEIIHAGDTLAVFGEPEEINSLIYESKR